MINTTLKDKKSSKSTSSMYFIIFIFAILSLLSVTVMMHYDFLGNGDDLRFHWLRIWEMRDSLKHGIIFPKVALNEFNQSGSAVMTMYPYFNLYPIAILSMFSKSLVSMVYVIFVLRTFLSLLISFFSAYFFKHDKKVSFVFAVTYSLSGMVIKYAFQSADLGISSSLIYMPMVLFGFYELLYHKKWLELSLGMTMVIYCHVLNTMIILLMLVILASMNYKQVRSRLGLFFKAVGLTFALTSIFVIPFVITEVYNGVNMPPLDIHLGGTDLVSFLTGVTGNLLSADITIVALVGLIVSIIVYKKLDGSSRQMFWTAVIFLFICSNFFPWNLLDNTFVRQTLQFSWRLFIIPQLLLCYLFAVSLFKIFKDYKKSKLVIITVSLFVICTQFIAQQEFITLTINNPELTQVFGPQNVGQGYKMTNDAEFKNMIDPSNDIPLDYSPKNSALNSDLIAKRELLYSQNNSDQHIQTNLLGNGKFSFSNNDKIEKLTLPFFYYKNFNYQIKLDGKLITYSNSPTNLIMINNVNPGKHTLQISVQNTFLNYICYLLFIIGLVVVAYQLYDKRKKSSVSFISFLK